MFLKYVENFAESLSKSIKTMFDIDFTTQKDNEILEIDTSSELHGLYPLWINVPFFGPISGDYFICINKKEWENLAIKSFQMEIDKKLFFSMLKELLNTACSESIELVKKDFPGISISSPRIITGEIEYPKLNFFNFKLIHQNLAPIQGVFAINAMQSEISFNLEEEKYRANRAEKNIHMLMHNVPIGVFQMDLNGIILPGCSKHLEKLFFKPLKNIIGAHFIKACPQTMAKEGLQHLFDWLTLLKTTDLNSSGYRKPFPPEIDFIYRKKRYIYRVEFFQLFQEKEKRVMVLIEDITQAKILELKLREAEKTYTKNLEQRVSEQTKELKAINTHLIKLNKSLRTAKLEAERANDFKSSFLAQMTHDLRTPLHVVIGILDMVSRSDTIDKNQEIKEPLNIALKSAERQLTLVNDILDISKVESGKLSINCIPFNITEILQELNLQMKTLLANKPVKFILDNQLLKTNHNLISDKKCLGQIITNLLGNAAKFTTSGEIKLSLFITENKLYFEVTDTGLGMNESDTKTIFESYTMVDNELQNQHKGTGLGLSICKGFVEALGGKIKVQSKKGKGSCFTFWVPYIQSDKTECLEQKKAELNISQLRNKHVLMCDDDEFNLAFADMILKEKINYSFAKNGKDAINLATTKSFDLILLDIFMPELDGKETLKNIRKNKINTPVIALTARNMKGDREELLDYGFTDYLAKPFKETDLLQTLLKNL